MAKEPRNLSPEAIVQMLTQKSSDLADSNELNRLLQIKNLEILISPDLKVATSGVTKAEERAVISKLESTNWLALDSELTADHSRLVVFIDGEYYFCALDYYDDEILKAQLRSQSCVLKIVKVTHPHSELTNTKRH